MTQDKKLDRKSFLTSTVAACAAVSFGACSDEGDGGGTDDGGSDDVYACTTVTTNGMHSHPLTIPSSDVEKGEQSALYILEDGGTGHTHTLEMSAYEYLYLSGGTEVMTVSSMDAGHTHPITINCVRN